MDHHLPLEAHLQPTSSQAPASPPHAAPEPPQDAQAWLAATSGRSLHRFARKISPVDAETGCWLWQGAIGSDGYGRVRRRGVTYSAHRFSYALFKGPIPDELCVMHRCDTPACVNPTHLVLGTKADNSRDMLRKGRDGLPVPKLSFEQALEVRALLARGATKATVCERFGICRSTVQDIEAGASWSEDGPHQGWLFADDGPLEGSR